MQAAEAKPAACVAMIPLLIDMIRQNTRTGRPCK
jgi:hypothetical protein